MATTNKELINQARDNNGFTALHWAATKGFTPLVKFLVDNGADPKDAETSSGQTPLVFHNY